MASKLLYNVEDKPSWGKTIIFAFQQLLAILAATIAVPAIINNSVPGADMSTSAALFGAGIGTLIYLICTKFRSPVFLGSSFAFIPSMLAAFGGGVSAAFGYLGIVIGALFMGLVYLAISIVVRFVGTKWVDKIMPPVVIGPTVALIGLSLAKNAVADFQTGGLASTSTWIAMLIGFITLVTIIVCSLYGNSFIKIIPFIIGIAVGYAVASMFTGIGFASGVEELKVVDWSALEHIEWVPNFAVVKAFGAFNEMSSPAQFWIIVGGAALGYIPVAFVIFAEHIADHKNLSSIIDRDLLTNPGLHRTLMGDALGSMVGASCGGCPITTYGESVGCVAISGNASIRTILVTSILCMVLAFIGPFTAALSTIPSCVMGGVCISLYGFIAVSGFKMIQKVNLDDKSNVFVVSIILIVGIGGLILDFGPVQITAIAVALIMGIIVNLIAAKYRKNEAKTAEPEKAEDKEEIK